MLRGNALAKVDEKGRLKLPSAFRSVLEPRYGVEFFVTSLRGDCVRMYPLQEFEEFERRIVGASDLRPLLTKLKNALSYYGQRAAMDPQGRVLIHPLLRQRAAIDGDVAVIGQQTYLEVWNREAFEHRVIGEPLTDEELERLAALGL